MPCVEQPLRQNITKYLRKNDNRKQLLTRKSVNHKGITSGLLYWVLS
jgi:hypothetical protein